MGTRLIIEGNTVYEIEEDCQKYSRGCEKEVVVAESYGMKKKKNKELTE